VGQAQFLKTQKTKDAIRVCWLSLLSRTPSLPCLFYMPISSLLFCSSSCLLFPARFFRHDHFDIATAMPKVATMENLICLCLVVATDWEIAIDLSYGVAMTKFDNTNYH